MYVGDHMVGLNPKVVEIHGSVIANSQNYFEYGEKHNEPGRKITVYKA